MVPDLRERNERVRSALVLEEQNDAHPSGAGTDFSRAELLLDLLSDVVAHYEPLVAPLLRGVGSGERFPQFTRRLGRRLETINQVNREQVGLLRALRAGGGPDVRTALLLSINCAAAGLGATG